ncbi:MAG: hypothetical protein A3G52_04090 [Candidatus Taylorbacteria bacterium RIFCSPLOWO2_12_FULL_43_20]|uniref:Uncharacterized protein n=1 Tax=Candidatus Taylorbacteria bacterium RIFCSPLOWO2_12_FULL_43_20 TaxID=1802332 RepID=A0A1G2P2H1_9BACT|nr:MAG: hypothetical protein A2825_00290 [Candidatus Taylorbacteria bacterium RIFCSPHIGHO2_01_FULL_43_120]OHA22569.1 MAG: hypothetical protein A3B98_02650 [Candidatus Taylorbacteria bacterium RIFCSPHIGHO2_02_FULL_43_55]OHA28603.1 MAG: hypothetical protein A3E92_01525 [Candidatus Taylorbacteria bacterium RIFCSPHIGHO2_12_FULL_42_34]OHA30517.1 MAG: hypothetical protein A3B09_00165 [Candidatus Taylorbacteria bacterium RIFCSPLOWO2_01_FULL_43_83]OHA38103.1 MAG: hypothetical protein A3H58_00980 [Candi
MNKNIIYSAIVSISLIYSAFILADNRTDAQSVISTPFGGRITQVEYCCNGLKITIDESARSGGEFFLSWADVANPEVNYRNYQVFTPGRQNTVGQGRIFATCTTMSSKCESSEVVQDGAILRIGTGNPF